MALKSSPPTNDEGLEPVREPVFAENYEYWRNHGAGWADEYAQRKRARAKYHIQEIMLATYVAQCAPAKVLEFGCGVGRHLSYLSKLPGIEAYGYDQSATMVQNCLRWTSQRWIDEHIVVGEPVGALPYPDKFFDVAFSAEVLIHVRPEDLERVLGELLRVAKWHVFHIEPAQQYRVLGGDHLGCWDHDLVAAYDRLGHECAILPAGYADHAPYRVVLDASRPLPGWLPAMLGLMRRWEDDFEAHHIETLDRVGRLEREVSDVRAESERARVRLAEVEGECNAMRQDTESAIARRAQLETANRELEDWLQSAEQRNAHLLEWLRGFREREQYPVYAGWPRPLPPDDEVLRQVEELAFEFAYLRSRGQQRLMQRLAHTWPMRLVRWLMRGTRDLVVVEPLGTKSEESKGCEVWLLKASCAAFPLGVPLSAQWFDPRWTTVRENEHVPFNRCLSSVGKAKIRIVLPEKDAELCFLLHDWSGRVAVTAAGRTTVIDLWSREHAVLGVRPYAQPADFFVPTLDGAGRLRTPLPEVEPRAGSEA